MLRYLKIWKGKDEKWYGEHPGCGCCGGPGLIDLQTIQKYIEELEEELSKAIEAREELA